MLRAVLFTVLIFTLVITAAEKDTSGITFSGWGYFTFGKVVKSPTEAGQYDINFENEWLADFDAGLKAVALLGKSGKARLHFGMTTAYLLLDYRKDNAEFLRRRFVPYLIDAALEHTFQFGRSTMFTEFGFFPVKYNPQAANLGEYLFRSGTYPGYLSSGFEQSDKEKLTGVHASYNYNFTENSNIKGDLYFSNDMRDYPIHDFSLSYIVSGSILKIAELGAGISHAHLITLDERKTTPVTDSIVFRKGTPYWNNVGYVDSTGDTIEYTFRGTKGMARLTLNPQAFFSSRFLGKEDLKIYGEVALLGFKNYPYWYQNINERVPVMFGMNLPTHPIFSYGIVPAAGCLMLENLSRKQKAGAVLAGIASAGLFTWLEEKSDIRMGLDLLSTEVEWYGSKYWNTTENLWLHRSPLPYNGSPVAVYDEFKPRTDDDWKWSVYASKRIANRIKISAQVASDHILRTQYMPPPPSFSKYTEIVPRTRDWYWMTRMMFYF